MSFRKKWKNIGYNHGFLFNFKDELNKILKLISIKNQPNNIADIYFDIEILEKNYFFENFDLFGPILIPPGQN